jgi:serine/threonine protein kinase
VDAVALLTELVKAELRCRYERGEMPTVAEYLDRYPQLRRADSRILSLIYEEFCLSEERGHTPDVDKFCERYAEWKDSLVSQLQYHRVISQAAGARPSLPRFPEPGENFEEFHLVSTLGKGGTSRVYLAKDLSLGGKQVVLKISLDRGREPQVHGRLVHPHIVPVHSVTFQPDHRLRGLSMPFQPGLPLDVIIARVNPSSRPRKAIALWHALVDGAAKGLIPCAKEDIEALLRDEILRVGPRSDGWQDFPVRGTYPEGAAWIAMIVARALDYAHGMQTFHRDVKPANVLLTLAHGPQLFDFNLAESPHSADRAQEALHGGTLPYMAPEQIQAFLDPKLWDQVGAQADVYSLGLVLRELLTGQMPELPDGKLPPQRAMRQLLDRRALLDVAVRQLNPKTPHALEAIVAKCLASPPEKRYQSAGALAQDLDRFLKNLPLVHAVNPSRRERSVSWAKRHRWIIASATANMILLVLLGFLLYPKVKELWRLPVEKRPEFRQALDAIKRGESSLALEALWPLRQDYSRSPSFLLCLSIALYSDQFELQAESRFEEALKAPGAEKVLERFVRDHPAVAESFIQFATDRYKVEYLRGDEGYNTEARVEFFELARKALGLAERIKPDDPRIQRRLARTEAFFGRYEDAYQRLKRLIESTTSTDAGGEELYIAYLMRGWIATRWVSAIRSQGARPLANGEWALKLMKQADEDLTRSEKWRDSNYIVSVRERLLEEYYRRRDKLEATLTLIELQIELGHPDDAARRLHRAEMETARYLSSAKMSMPVLEAANSSNKNLTALETARLTQRLENARNRLRALGSVDSVVAKPPPV